MLLLKYPKVCIYVTIGLLDINFYKYEVATCLSQHASMRVSTQAYQFQHDVVTKVYIHKGADASKCYCSRTYLMYYRLEGL